MTQRQKMKIAGLQTLSLVDFPGCTATAVFLQGCNFRCGYCQNPDLVTCKKDFGYSEKDLFDFLDKRRNMIEGVVVTGGEPTVNGTLPAFIRRIKELGFKVKLDTNGTDPDQLEGLLREYLIDYIAVDIKTSFEKYGLVTDMTEVECSVSESIRIAILSTTPYEFRTTCVPGIVDAEDFRKIGEVVKGAKKYCLQQFRPEVTYDPAFRDIRPYSKNDLENFRGILAEYVEEVGIRGI